MLAWLREWRERRARIRAIENVLAKLALSDAGRDFLARRAPGGLGRAPREAPTAWPSWLNVVIFATFYWSWLGSGCGSITLRASVERPACVARLP